MTIKKLLSTTARNQAGSITIPAIRPVGFGLHYPNVQVSKKHLNTAIVVTAMLLSATVYVYVAQFFMPKKVMYSYGATSCFTNPVLLPQATSFNQASNFAITSSAKVSLGSLVLYSHKACITPVNAPLQAQSQVVKQGVLGQSKVSKNITIQSAGAATAKLTSNISVPVSSKGALQFTLKSSDSVFTYRLYNASLESECTVQDALVSCSLASLQLKQGAEQQVELKRVFNNLPVESLATVAIKTIDPLQVISASITNNQKIYTVPTGVTLQMSKPIVATDKAVLWQIEGDTKTVTATTNTFKDNQVSIEFTNPLPRSATFELILASATGTDDSTLQQPYALSFTTSGGPVVTGTNVGSYKVSTAPIVTVTFDSELLAKQNLGQFIKLTVNGTAVASAVSVNGKNVTIKPLAPFARCTPFTIVVDVGIASTYGVADGKSWQYASRTVCQTSYSIGTSVLGRPITAYSFGDGPSKVVFVGGMHGNEKSSVYTLDALVDDLEKNGTSVPANKTIIVIPNNNPDGFAVSSRLNARNIDLNRNYNANNWQTDVSLPKNVPLAGGGGTAPLSEPESAALAAFVLQQAPRLVLTYHATARSVIPNEAGDSFALATIYSAHSGYPAISNSASDEAFGYTTTGEFEDWLHDKHNIPALLVELSTMTANQFTSQKSAMWAMIKS